MKRRRTSYAKSKANVQWDKKIVCGEAGSLSGGTEILLHTAIQPATLTGLRISVARIDTAQGTGGQGVGGGRLALVWCGESYNPNSISSNILATADEFYQPEQNVLWFCEVPSTDNGSWSINEATTAARKMKFGDKLYLLHTGIAGGIRKIHFTVQFFLKS